MVALRALDVPLTEIARSLADPTTDRVGLLKRHRMELLARADRINDLIDALDRAIARTPTSLSADDIRTLAHGFDPAAHGQEAAERWGGEPAVAEAHRAHIDRWFYPCSPQRHRQLATLYLDDPRFREHFEQRAEGLAAYCTTPSRPTDPARRCGPPAVSLPAPRRCRGP